MVASVVKEVQLLIKSSIIVNLQDEPEVMAIETEATYYHKDVRHYVYFEENVDGQFIKNLYKFNQGQFYMSKQGGISVEMNLTMGEIARVQYKTPYGGIPMLVETKKLILEERDDLIRIKIEYTLSIQEGEKQIHELIMEIRPRE